MTLLSAMISTSRLQDLIGRFREQRVLVVGDLMLDEFVWGGVTRISPEAPVPIVEVREQKNFPGGAANVARNLREFGVQTAVMGLIGRDAHGQLLATLLEEENVSLAGVQRPEDYQTIVKTRIIARQQHVVRVDRETAPANVDFTSAALRRFEEMLPEFDAVIIEDYAKGFVTQSLADGIGASVSKSGKILTIDPNPRNDLRWTGARAIKPNRGEAIHAAGGAGSLEHVGATLLGKWGTDLVLITLGEDGMLLFEKNASAPMKIEPCHRREVFDVSGAGDTAIALLTIALSAGAMPLEAAEIANHAASVVVGKLGTATLTPQELAASFEDHYP